ncbi:MAG TPA: hypothetical protein VKF79_12725 [Candidatus Acidoferrum sp.]|nr:hypothetical protein [Candidatus Acidoferrum sp.]
MSRRVTTFLAGCAALALVLCMPATSRAQDQNPDEAPKPAARAYPPIDASSDDQPSPDTLLPDGRPLTGVQNATLGRIESPHSYWQPGFQYSNTIQNSYPGQTGSGWSITNYFAANVSLLESWRAAQLAINYSGGGDVSTQNAIGNGFFQQVGASQSFQWARWQLQFFDQFAYLPQSQFGFGGGTGLSLPGGGSAPGVPQTGIGSGITQSLFTAVGPRYNNTFTTQAIYQLSPRASVNVSGTYGILRFVDKGNIDDDNAGGSIGFNYQLSKEDTIGLVYHYNRFSYVGQPQVIGDNSINLAYGKKITGRVALQVFGGPDITTFSVPIGTTTKEVSGSGGASLSYAINRGSLGIAYNHGVTAGSGVYAGATTDQVTGSIGRNLTRVWSAHANIGFAKNRSIVGSAAQNSYDSVTVAGGVSRSFGPNTNFSLAYTANIQTTNAPSGCTGTNCNSTYTQHQITMNFQWHTRPLVLR